MENKKLINAYVKMVVARLEPSVRSDVEMELSQLIEEEMQNSKKSVEEVLEKFGNPKKLAEDYGGKKRYVIGPMYYDLYFGLLKIILPIIVLALLIANVVGYIFNGDITIGAVLGSFINGPLYGFAYITLGFMAAEYFSDKHNIETWSVKDIKVEDESAKLLSKSEAVVGLVVLSVLFVLLNIRPELFAIYNISGGTSVPFFNLASFDMNLLLLNIAVGLGIIGKFFKLYFGKITKQFAILNTIVYAGSTLFVVIVFTSSSFINPNINADLLEMGFSSSFDFYQLFRRILVIISILISLGWLADSIKNIVFGFKWNKKVK